MIIRKASIDDLTGLTTLFSEYRMFYGQADEPEQCRKFLVDRFARNESVVFLAMVDDSYAGFTQLYPSFTSVGLKEIWILNDLYVNERFRRQGVAQGLIEAVLRFSKETNRKKVVLSTAQNNYNAQRLYEKLGFTRDNFYNYEKLIE